FFRLNSDKRAMITFHSIGDMDCVSSAFGIAKILKNSSIRAPDFISSNARFAIEQAGIEMPELGSGFDEGAEIIVLVDVNNFEDCGRFEKRLEESPAQIAVIDHHAFPKAGKALVFNDESYNSTASIVYELLKSLDISLDRPTSELLAMGIYSDSAEFRNATAKSFVQIGELLEISGLGFQQLLEKFSKLAPAEARERTVDELFDSETMIVKGRLFVKGTTSVHAAIAADDAIKIGADIALFCSESESEISFSARCRPTLDAEMNLHLGKIMRSISSIIEGTGGGHPCAAGAYGPKKEGKDAFIKAFQDKVFRDQR
ncbi:DHH family phosphoesterase, partial [Candidatus Marsarchaeota archaeon]|nr:DHH family phosphoesterase [Candidatus Marsarchaeota archaeon]